MVTGAEGEQREATACQHYLDYWELWDNGDLIHMGMEVGMGMEGSMQMALRNDLSAKCDSSAKCTTK